MPRCCGKPLECVMMSSLTVISWNDVCSVLCAAWAKATNKFSLMYEIASTNHIPEIPDVCFPPTWAFLASYSCAKGFREAFPHSRCFFSTPRNPTFSASLFCTRLLAPSELMSFQLHSPLPSQRFLASLLCIEEVITIIW